MSANKNSSNLITKLILKFFSVEEKPYDESTTPQNILIVRQHNQFGDLLASVSLFRAVKETHPNSHLTVIVSPQNYYAVIKNEFIDKLFVFNQKKLLLPSYFYSLISLLRKQYDLVVVPATVSISKTSCLLGRFAKSDYRIGPASLDGKPNQLARLFHKRINLNWKKYPDTHISDFGLEILRSLGITTKIYRSSIGYDENDLQTADDFACKIGNDKNKNMIGFHIGAGKPPNRWSLEKFIKIIEKLNEDYNSVFYITGSSSDNEEINYVKDKLPVEVSYFINKTIPEVAALISISDLFITNDTGVMHVAGATETPQISIFGPTNPFNWAPLGPNKFFIRKSDLIDDVTVSDVFDLCKLILGNKNIKGTGDVNQ
ncbi:hypothetical protein ASZ90_003192 [hydrocarbon metagenome]|uniref:Adp-heptose--lipooligosaccharide heptosyltransferase ii n=1 Tax=hydrocarbon metagenome TaxID=938273 RepID=A0A0W8G1M9_9ZZZZ